MSKPRLFFDGFCNLCERTVLFLSKRNLDLEYLTLQSDEAEEVLEEIDEMPDHGSVILEIDGEFYMKSDVFLVLMRRMTLPWKILGYIASAIPKYVRNRSYDFIAKHRYSVFGTKEKCAIPEELRK